MIHDVLSYAGPSAVPSKNELQRIDFWYSLNGLDMGHSFPGLLIKFAEGIAEGVVTKNQSAF